MNVFGQTCCIMACPIDERRTDFSFPTNKLSKKIWTDLGKYSQFFSEDFIPSGEEQLLLLASNSFIAFFMILTIVCIAPVLLLTPTNIETKPPFETWIRLESCLIKVFCICIHLLCINIMFWLSEQSLMVTMLIILVAHFFIRHELYLHKKRTVTIETISYLSICANNPRALWEKINIFIFNTLCKKWAYHGTWINQMIKIDQLVLNKRKFPYRATVNKLFNICLNIFLTIGRIISW